LIRESISLYRRLGSGELKKDFKPDTKRINHFLRLTSDEREKEPYAFKMKGNSSFRVRKGRVKTLELTMETLNPIPVFTKYIEVEIELAQDELKRTFIPKFYRREIQALRQKLKYISNDPARFFGFFKPKRKKAEYLYDFEGTASGFLGAGEPNIGYGGFKSPKALTRKLPNGLHVIAFCGDEIRTTILLIFKMKEGDNFSLNTEDGNLEAWILREVVKHYEGRGEYGGWYYDLDVKRLISFCQLDRDHRTKEPYAHQMKGSLKIKRDRYWVPGRDSEKIKEVMMDLESVDPMPYFSEFFNARISFCKELSEISEGRRSLYRGEADRYKAIAEKRKSKPARIMGKLRGNYRWKPYWLFI